MTSRPKISPVSGLVASFVALIVVGLSACSAVNSGGESAADDGVSFELAWSTPVTADMSGIYGELKNESNADVTVVSATSNVATMAHFILTTTDASGVTSSSESATGFVIPAGGTLQLAAKETYIMLMGFTKTVTSGDSIVLTLNLSAGEPIDVTLPVQSSAPAASRSDSDSSSSDSVGGMDPNMPDMDHKH